mmetsp:Transcript_9143/g.15666  ORF Transcript_9143/g.15666 Transcript_9143/m.15666 type:complete len:200 (-) Transcript_9143:1650-2249(-)
MTRSVISSSARISRSSAQVPCLLISCKCSSKLPSLKTSKRLRCRIKCSTQRARNSSCRSCSRYNWCEMARNRQLPSPSIANTCNPFSSSFSRNRRSLAAISSSRRSSSVFSSSTATATVTPSVSVDSLLPKPKDRGLPLMLARESFEAPNMPPKLIFGSPLSTLLRGDSAVSFFLVSSAGPSSEMVLIAACCSACFFFL